MEQPELGRRIAELRKQKGVTQDELVARCNVNVRTIQRIEAGEVMPRPSTLRLIVDALETDWESFTKAFREKSKFGAETFASSPEPLTGTSLFKRDLQVAWIAGVVYFLAGFPEAAIEWEIIESKYFLNGSWFYIIKIITLISFALFMRGFIMLGKCYSNKLLVFASALFLMITLVDYGFDLFFSPDHLFSAERQIGKAMMYGCASVVFGVALFKAKEQLGNAGHYAGLLEIAIGLSFLTVLLFPVGLVLMMPAEILEIYLLFKFSKSMEPVLTNEGKVW